MIASVRGTVAALAPDAAVVEVGGVGLLVHCTPATLARLRIGEPAALATALVVREDSLTLFGFADADERDVFETLQTAGGVGPRLAQAALGVHSPNALRRAVATEDIAALTLVPGIGRKGAQRILLELKDRLGLPGDDGPLSAALPGAATPAWQLQLRSALLGLGYASREADEAVATVAAGLEQGGAGGSADGAGGPPADGTGAPPPLASLLRQALAVLRPS